MELYVHQPLSNKQYFRNLRSCILFVDGMFVSLGESKALKLIENNRAGVIKMNQHMLVRTYPAGSRTDSSNYNPLPMWNAGCQVGQYRVYIQCLPVDDAYYKSLGIPGKHSIYFFINFTLTSKLHITKSRL